MQHGGRLLYTRSLASSFGRSTLRAVTMIHRPKYM